MSPGERVRRYAEKSERLVIGLMSGTSLDGVDAALVRISGSGRATRTELLSFLTYPFPTSLRDRTLAVCRGAGDAETVSRLGFALGVLFADAAEAVVRKGSVRSEEIDAVGSHGQTVSHTPQASDLPAATLQIGEPSFIAHRLGAPVVYDFRTADVAAGGQGAPLVPYADWCLLTHATKNRAVQNIGGIGNVTFLPANAASDVVLGFDTGPGNLLIDQAAQWATNGASRFDEGGRIGRSGRVDTGLLARLISHPFLQKTPPKSAGREEFGEVFWSELRETAEAGSLAPADLVATVTAFTAGSIVDAYRRFLPRMPDEVIVGGGGARNPFLMQRIRQECEGIPVFPSESMGIDSDAKEALAFSLLANETLLGNPANLPSVTGARRPTVLGKIALP